jgi:hypothetical protein
MPNVVVLSASPVQFFLTPEMLPLATILITLMLAVAACQLSCFDTGALETQEFRTTPVPFWLVCFSDAIKGPLHQMFFVVLVQMGRLLSREWRSGCRQYCRSEENQTIDPQRSNRSSSEILDLTVLVPNNHGVPRIDYRYFERTVVFTLEQKHCLIL